MLEFQLQHDLFSRPQRTVWALGFPGGIVVNNLPASAGDPRDRGFRPWVEKIPGVGNGNPLQYSCLERIPLTEEPDGLQSTGSQRVGPN